jgi:hypothetical protein
LEVHVIVRTLVGALALLLGVASVLLLLEGFSEQHGPGGYILLVTAGAACLMVAVALLLGLLLIHRA